MKKILLLGIILLSSLAKAESNFDVFKLHCSTFGTASNHYKINVRFIKDRAKLISVVNLTHLRSEYNEEIRIPVTVATSNGSAGDIRVITFEKTSSNDFNISRGWNKEYAALKELVVRFWGHDSYENYDLSVSSDRHDYLYSGGRGGGEGLICSDR